MRATLGAPTMRQIRNEPSWNVAMFVRHDRGLPVRLEYYDQNPLTVRPLRLLSVF